MYNVSHTPPILQRSKLRLRGTCGQGPTVRKRQSPALTEDASLPLAQLLVPFSGCSLPLVAPVLPPPQGLIWKHHMKGEVGRRVWMPTPQTPKGRVTPAGKWASRIQARKHLGGQSSRFFLPPLCLPDASSGDSEESPGGWPSPWLAVSPATVGTLRKAMWAVPLACTPACSSPRWMLSGLCKGVSTGHPH